MKFALCLIFLYVVLIQTEGLTWKQHKQDYDENYLGDRKESLQFSTFQENQKTIEFTERQNGKFDFSKLKKNPNLRMPASLDWRDVEGVVPEVPEATECKSGWAINVIDSIEAQNVILNNNHTKLSVQELVDCADLGQYNSGCDGGSVDSAFDYIINKGIFTNSTYPWLGETTSICANYEETSSKVRIVGVKRVASDLGGLEMALAYVGPMVALIDSRFIDNYNGSDVYYANDCLTANETTINHPVLVVGYSNLGGYGHWIVRNSLGTSWGDEGYLKLTKVVHHDCGVTSHVLYPILESDDFN